MSDPNDQNETLEGECTTDVFVKFDQINSRIEVYTDREMARPPVYSRYLLEGETPENALDEASDLVKRLLRRKWALAFQGKA